MITKTDLLQDVENKVGTFSDYQTSAGPGDKIPFTKRPAQKILEKLGVPSTDQSHIAPLSRKADQSVISTETNAEVTITSFDDTKPGELKITGERITRLIKSAKTYVNTDIIPKGKFKDVLKAKSSISRDIEDQTGIHWQNLAVGICHAQEVDLLVEQVDLNQTAGKAIAGVRTGTIDIDAPAMVLLSSPALDFSGAGGLGNSLREDQRKSLIKGMYANLFNAAIDQKCKAITLPAAGLGVFEGNHEHYHQALFALALEFPQLKIIYNPGEKTAEFTKSYGEFIKQNPNTKLRMTNKDVVFLADKLTGAGVRTACHNRSDSKVVLAEYDIGMHWKQSNQGSNKTYVGEEHIGAMSTAPINSFGLNPGAYNDFVEVSFKKDLTFEAPKNPPSDAAKKAIEVISKIVDRFEENDEATLSSKEVTLISKTLTNLFNDDLDHIQLALKEKGVELDLRLAKTKSSTTRSQAINTCLTSKKAVSGAANVKDTQPVETVQFNYFEKSNYDYFAVDKEGNLVCLVPFTACNDYYISSENTCKTGQTMRAALVGKFPQQPIILQVLDQYMLDLRNDMNLLGFKTNKTDHELHDFLLTEIATTTNETLKGKAKRLIQLTKYKTVLLQVTSDSEITANLTSFSANFPPSLNTVLSQSNAVGFNIKTQAKGEDPVLRAQSTYVCTFTRGMVATSFSNQLKTSLNARAQTLRVKKPKIHLTKDQLLEKIYAKYQADTKYKKLDSGSYPITKPEDIQILRNAILESIKGLVPDFANWKMIINQPYHNKQDNVRVPDADLPQFVDDVLCIPPEELSCFDLIDGILLTVEQMQELTKDPDCLPFEEQRINTAPVFNDLIQIFIASANYAYIEYAKSKNYPNERSTNFGKCIEFDSESTGFLFTQLKQVSLIKAIESAIDKKLPLEEAILDWLEGHVLNNKPTDLKKFDSETRTRANAIFRAHFSTLYDLIEPSPHNDEYMMAIANDPQKPIVVRHRGALSVPLSNLCDAFTSKPWLKEAFKESNLDISLPKAVQLNFDSDNIAVTSCVPEAACTVNVMTQLDVLIKNDPLSAAKFLINTTKEGKKIHELLNNKQAEGLKKYTNWSVVQNHVYSLITNISENVQFKNKFQTKATIHITLEIEQALYAVFSQYSDINKLFEGVKRGESIKLAVRGLCNSKGITGNFVTDITATGTYIFECDNPVIINLIKKTYHENKTCMTITSKMAGNFYKQINETAPGIAETVQANSGVHAQNSAVSGMTDRYGIAISLNPKINHIGFERGNPVAQIPQIGGFGKAIPSNITSDHKFIKTLKVLFPDLTILGSAEPLPEGINEGSDDLIRVKFNAFNGYQITSLNPDNLNRIRDCYQTSTTRVLSFLEAKKFIHYAAGEQNTKLKKPLELNTATLEAALIELGIVYSAVGQVDQTYQIICEELPWETIKNIKNSVKVKPDFKPEPDLCTYEMADEYFKAVNTQKTDWARELLSKNPTLRLAKEFFDAIGKGDTDRAKELLAMHPTLLNSSNPNYPSSPLITAITFAFKGPGQNQISLPGFDLVKYQTSLLHFALELLATPGIELAHKDKGGNTCLHKSIFYADLLRIKQKTTDSFDKISAEIFKKAQIEGSTKYFETEINSQKELAFRHDHQNRLRKMIFKNSFWDLLTETRYFNFTPALEFLTKEKAFDDVFKREILNEKHPKTNKLLLEMAIERGNSTAVIDLIKKGVNPSKALSNNKTPLELAIELGHSDVVLGLIFQGCNINVAFANKKYPLELAIESGNVAVVGLLLTNNANPDQTFTAKDADDVPYKPFSLALALSQNKQIVDAQSKSKQIMTDLAIRINHYQLGQFVCRLNDKYLEAQKTLTTSQQNHAELDAQFQELQKNPLVNMEKKEKNQQQLLDEHEAKLTQLATEIALSQSKQQQLQKDLDNLKSVEMQLAIALDVSKGHEAKLSSVNQRNESLSQQIQEGGVQNSQLEQFAAEMQKNQGILERKNKRSQASIAKTSDKRNELKTELSPLRQEVKKLGTEKETLQTELNTLEQNKAALLTQIAEQTTQNSEKNTVLEQLTASYQRLEKDIAALEKKLHELPQKKAETEALVSKNKVVIEAHAKAKGEAVIFNQKLRSQETVNAELLKSFALKEAETLRLREALRQQESAQENLKQKTISAENQLSTATQQNKKLESDVNKLTKQSNDLVQTKDRLNSEITHLETQVGPLKSTEQQLKKKQADMDGSFILNCLNQLSGGEILAYSLLAFLLLASIAVIAVATWGTGLTFIAPIATTLLTAGIAGASVGGAGLMITGGYSLFSHCKKEPEEVLPTPKLKI